MSHLLQRHELRRPRRTDARPAVLHGPPGYRDLSQVVPDHLGLDLDGLERLPVVNGGLLADEVRQDRDVPAVRPKSLLVPLRRPEPFDEDRLLLVEAPPVRPPRPRGEELDHLLQGHRLHLVEGVPAIREFPLPADLNPRRAFPQLPPRRLRESAHLLRHGRLPPPALFLDPLRDRAETPDLAAGGCVPRYRGGPADVLVRTAPVGVVHRVHRDAPHPHRGLAEGPVREVLLPRLRERSLGPPRPRHDADRRSALRVEGAELAARQLEDDPLRVAHDRRGGPRRADELPAVPGFRFDVVDERPLRDRTQRERVPAIDVVSADGHDLADLEPVGRDHEHLEPAVPHPRNRGRPAGGVLDRGNRPFSGELWMRRDPGVAVARGPVRGRRTPSPSLLRQVLSHQYTPILIATSSARNSLRSLMIACFPSRWMYVFTFSTLTSKRVSNASLICVFVAVRRTMNSRRFPSVCFRAGVPSKKFSVFSVTYGCRRTSYGFTVIRPTPAARPARSP